VSVNQSPRQLRLSTYCCSPLLSLSQQFFSSSFASTLPLKAILKQFFSRMGSFTPPHRLLSHNDRPRSEFDPYCWPSARHSLSVPSKMLISPDKYYWITWVLQTETVSNRCCVNRQISVSYYQQISNCCRPVLTYRLTDLCHQWLTDCWSCSAFSLLWQFCTVSHGIFVWPM